MKLFFLKANELFWPSNLLQCCFKISVMLTCVIWAHVNVAKYINFVFNNVTNLMLKMLNA
jgi:hypothetical protein